MRLASFALFITWTTYGTWLPGDRRGYVSRTLPADGVFQPKRNQTGSPITPGNAQTLATAQKAQKYDTVWLDRTQALIAAQAIRQAALKRRWVIIRASVMANHNSYLDHGLSGRRPGGSPSSQGCQFRGIKQGRRPPAPLVDARRQ